MTFIRKVKNVYDIYPENGKKIKNVYMTFIRKMKKKGKMFI